MVRFYVLFYLSVVLLKTNAQIITTISGNGTQGYSGDGGQATAAYMYGPTCLAIDKLGNIFIADSYNNVVRKINTTGIITTFAGNGYGAGTGMGSYTGDGGQATDAELFNPAGVAFDTLGNLYIADEVNSCIRKVIVSTGIISTIAGRGNCGTNNCGDGGPATLANLRDPSGIAFDSHGNLFIADTYNNCIRKVNTLGIISTVAGNATGGFSGDGGQATAAGLNSPYSITIDTAGNLFIADMGNNRIRKVNTTGIINTVAGGNIAIGDGGSATAARLGFPTSLAFDTMGNMYIADNNDSRIRKVDPFGIISTVVGNGTSVYSGDGGLATSAGLVSPYGIAIDKLNNFYIADGANNRIRVVSNISTVSIKQYQTNRINVMVFPNPTTGTLYINLSAQNAGNMLVRITDVNGRVLINNTYTANAGGTNSYTLDLSSLENGVYAIAISDDAGNVLKRDKVILAK